MIPLKYHGGYSNNGYIKPYIRGIVDITSAGSLSPYLRYFG